MITLEKILTELKPESLNEIVGGNKKKKMAAIATTQVAKLPAKLVALHSSTGLQ